MRLRRSLLLALALILPACSRGGDTPPATLPLAPDGVAASWISSTRIQVTWNDNSDNEANFIVQTSPDGAVWTDALVVDQGVTTAILTGQTPGALVHVRVASSNAKGDVPSAASVTVTLPAPVWEQLESCPAALFWACSAFDPVSRRFYVFGGVDGSGTVHNALHVLDVDAPLPPPTGWISLTPPGAPLPRLGASLIHDPPGNRLILFGGQIGGQSDSTNELWEFRIGTSTWNQLSLPDSPLARQHHSAVYDSANDRMVVFGGVTADLSQRFSDVAVLSLPPADVPAWPSFTTGGGPEARDSHSAVYDETAGRMLVFGGRTDMGLAQDLWSLDLSGATSGAWASVAIAGPPPVRQGHYAAWDSVNGQMIVFGGADEFDFPNDEVWILTFQGTPAWTDRTPASSAGPRALGTAVFDPLTIRMIVFGGVIDDSLSTTAETWALQL